MCSNIVCKKKNMISSLLHNRGIGMCVCMCMHVVHMHACCMHVVIPGPKCTCPHRHTTKIQFSLFEQEKNPPEMSLKPPPPETSIRLQIRLSSKAPSISTLAPSSWARPGQSEFVSPLAVQSEHAVWTRACTDC